MVNQVKKISAPEFNNEVISSHKVKIKFNYNVKSITKFDTSTHVWVHLSQKHDKNRENSKIHRSICLGKASTKNKRNKRYLSPLKHRWMSELLEPKSDFFLKNQYLRSISGLKIKTRRRVERSSHVGTTVQLIVGLAMREFAW